MDTSPTESYAPIKIEMQPEYVDTPMNNVVTEPTKRRKQRSIIWEDFTLKDVGDGETRAVCMTCTEDFAYIKGSKHVGTSHLKRHLESHKRLSKVSVDSAGPIKQTPKRRSKTASVPVASDSAGPIKLTPKRRPKTFNPSQGGYRILAYLLYVYIQDANESPSTYGINSKSVF
ncbi:zinc finger BED domain-containing protein DAYSLEEPER-like protein [Tanacetum coccineum]|uniref:Zinc finger BED domain-containing protein DAYSLEEPER-like protein n=1 Tax=Tanacetum coccineum TaxID=301880 RepID=A0ABQ5IL45_9ASTR